MDSLGCRHIPQTMENHMEKRKEHEHEMEAGSVWGLGLRRYVTKH